MYSALGTSCQGSTDTPTCNALEIVETATQFPISFLSNNSIASLHPSRPPFLLNAMRRASNSVSTISMKDLVTSGNEKAYFNLGGEGDDGRKIGCRKFLNTAKCALHCSSCSFSITRRTLRSLCLFLIIHRPPYANLEGRRRF